MEISEIANTENDDLEISASLRPLESIIFSELFLLAPTREDVLVAQQYHSDWFIRKILSRKNISH